MITTRQVNVNLDRGKVKLRHVTTKDINVGVRVEPPKEPIKKKSIATITTTTLPDVADVAEKKRRDDIMAEKKLAMKDDKKLVINKKGEASKGFMEGDAVYQKEEEVEKKLAVFIDEAGFKKLNTQFVFVEVDDLVQAISRRELK